VSLFEFDPFLSALNRTFRDMADIELVNGSIQTASESENADGLRADVSSVVGIFGPEKASLILTLTEEVALNIASIISGRRLELEDALVCDTAGELLNMTVGSAQRLSAVKFSFAIPVSIQGRGHGLRANKDNISKYVISKGAGGDVGLILVKNLE